MPTETTTNPDAEAKVLAATQTKQPPAIPASRAPAEAAPIRAIDPAKLQAPLAALKTATDALESAGDVTGDIRLASAAVLPPKNTSTSPPVRSRLRLWPRLKRHGSPRPTSRYR